MKLDPNEGDTRPFAQANVDSLNPGVKDRYGNRLPSGYHPHVDDHLYADNAKYFPLAVAASIVSLEDAFGGSHEFQENVLSDGNYTWSTRKSAQYLTINPIHVP